MEAATAAGGGVKVEIIGDCIGGDGDEVATTVRERKWRHRSNSSRRRRGRGSGGIESAVAGDGSDDIDAMECADTLDGFLISLLSSSPATDRATALLGDHWLLSSASSRATTTAATWDQPETSVNGVVCVSGPVYRMG